MGPGPQIAYGRHASRARARHWSHARMPHSCSSKAPVNKHPGSPLYRSPSRSSGVYCRPVLPEAYCWQAASWKSRVSRSVELSSASRVRTSAASSRSPVTSMACSRRAASSADGEQADNTNGWLASASQLPGTLVLGGTTVLHACRQAAKWAPHLGAGDVAAAHDLQLQRARGRHARQAQVQALQARQARSRC